MDEGAAQKQHEPMPGAVVIFTCGAPASTVLPMEQGVLVLGRQEGPDAVLADPRMSRRHAEIRFDGQHFTVRDLGSRNGTFADGAALAPGTPRQDPRWLRTGSSIVLLCRDARPLLAAGVSVVEGTVMGPATLTAWQNIGRIARTSDTLFVHGDSGTGKELAARAFHALGPRPHGPFVAVNCSAIPHAMAERLLFGTRRGAYSGAVANAIGYAQAAHRGTLFLDEIADLDLAVQAKLLRMLESREVLPLGAAHPEKVEIGICCATHKDLRAEVAAGRFRHDLYFRIGRPSVRLAPLRERPEEIPWLLAQAMAREPEPRLGVHSSLVDACLARPWPGNVRELLAESRAALHQALASHARHVHATHLGADAGAALVAAGAPDAHEPHEPHEPHELHEPQADPASAGDDLTGGVPGRVAIERALREHQGNVSAAARALGLHRTQLRRLLSRHGINPRAFPRQGSE